MYSWRLEKFEKIYIWILKYANNGTDRESMASIGLLAYRQGTILLSIKTRLGGNQGVHLCND